MRRIKALRNKDAINTKNILSMHDMSRILQVKGNYLPPIIVNEGGHNSLIQMLTQSLSGGMLTNVDGKLTFNDGSSVRQEEKYTLQGSTQRWQATRAYRQPSGARLVSDVTDGITNTNEIGRNGAIFTITVDRQEFERRAIIFPQNKSVSIFVASDGEDQGNGTWKYKCRLNSNDLANNYIHLNDMRAGTTLQPGANAQSELSRDGYLNLGFQSEEVDNYLTKSRWGLKMTSTTLSNQWKIDNVGKAIFNSDEMRYYAVDKKNMPNSVQMEVNGKQQSVFAYLQPYILSAYFSEIAKRTETSLLFGRRNVNNKGEVTLKDTEDRAQLDIVTGDGLIHQLRPENRLYYSKMTYPLIKFYVDHIYANSPDPDKIQDIWFVCGNAAWIQIQEALQHSHTSCLLYTSPSPRDRQKSRMPSSA